MKEIPALLEKTSGSCKNPSPSWLPNLRQELDSMEVLPEVTIKDTPQADGLKSGINTLF